MSRSHTVIMFSPAMIRSLLHKFAAFILATSIVLVGTPRRSHGGGTVPLPNDSVRMPSTALAVKMHGSRPARDTESLLRFGAMAYSAEPDSTGDEFDFPDDEEGHLARDITVFVIVSAFVAFFVIKVFLEGDTDDTGSDDGGGKDIPGF
ncbi:MAG: hypothetical protein IH969_09520 [Candidatus Krumholzibacteriota bacterium]|nr:hypothetical protein [Candidatus Krumholzibacteriota bacterium]